MGDLQNHDMLEDDEIRATDPADMPAGSDMNDATTEADPKGFGERIGDTESDDAASDEDGLSHSVEEDDDYESTADSDYERPIA
ncbi:hypothetical protein HJC99_02430 [Candidatus Saccharibacteria bacterium]|nr:hypothetical protein [Candidatus Saccharibacteria bacterium]